MVEFNLLRIVPEKASAPKFPGEVSGLILDGIILGLGVGDRVVPDRMRQHRDRRPIVLRLLRESPEIVGVVDDHGPVVEEHRRYAGDRPRISRDRVLDPAFPEQRPDRDLGVEIGDLELAESEGHDRARGQAADDPDRSRRGDLEDLILLGPGRGGEDHREERQGGKPRPGPRHPRRSGRATGAGMGPRGGNSPAKDGPVACRIWLGAAGS